VQLREVLFEQLKLPVKKRTKTGPSTDAEVLEELAAEGHQLPRLIIEFRELAKLKSTYVDALPALVDPRTNRIHTTFNQTVTSTGRLSSSDPNLQNIPIRTPLGAEIRKGFVPAEGLAFLGADYSQVELRILAHLSEDPAFVEAFQEGRDVHRDTAARIFGVGQDVVTPAMRATAKTVNFATIYGQGPFALGRQLGISIGEARAFIPGDPRVSRPSGRDGLRTGLRGDAVRTPPVYPRAQLEEPEHPRLRRARRQQLTDSGNGRRPYQAGDDQHPQRARRA
jgi:DNA polymerase-1